MAQNAVVFDPLLPELERLPCKRPEKLSTKARNDLKWDEHREEIRHMYVDQDSTLKQMMNAMQEKYGFKASERKWKMKIKEWQLKKNLSADCMSILVTKREKRLRDEGKETEFFHQGIQIREERFDNFKRRRTSKELVDMTTPSAETPISITYHTPAPQTPTLEFGLEELPFDPSNALEWDSRIHDEDGLAMTRPMDGHDVQNGHAFSNDAREDAQGPTPVPLFQILDLDEDSHYGLSSSRNPVIEFGNLKIHSVFSQDAQESGARVEGEEQHEWTPYKFAQITPPNSARGQLLDDPVIFGGLDMELLGSPALSTPSYALARHSPTSSLRISDSELEIQISRNQVTGGNTVEIENSLSPTSNSNLSPSKESLLLPCNSDNERNVQFVDEPYLTALWADIELYDNPQSGDWDEFVQYLQTLKPPNNLKKSIITGRKVVNKLEHDGQAPLSLKASSVGLLANLLERDEQLEEAETLYRKAIDMSNNNVAWRLEFYLGRILFRLDRFSEAAPMLLSSLAQPLQAQLSASLSIELFNILCYLRANLIKLKIGGDSWDKLKSLVSRIQTLLAWEIEKPVWNPIYDLDVLLLAVKLTVNCLLFWPETGRKLFLALCPKLCSLNFRKRVSECAQVYSQISGLREGYEMWKEIIAEIPAIYYTIRELSRALDITDVGLLTTLKEQWDRTPRIMSDADRDTINSIIMDSDADELELYLPDKGLCDSSEIRRILFTRTIGHDKREENRGKNSRDDSWTNIGSSRYGVTYTESGFSGISFNYSALFPPGI